MPKFAVVSDSCADLPLKVIQELELGVVPLTVTIDDKSFRNFPDEREITTKQFNDYLRNKAKPRTSQPNAQEVIEVVEPLLKSGQDVLLMSLSSNLSQTFNSMTIALTELKEKFPKQRIELFDTLNASLGEGLLVHKALLLRKDNKTLDETLAYLNSVRNKITTVVAFDDLSHLYRGGRINGAKFALGSFLGIKPVLYCSTEGKIVPVPKLKLRGRKNALAFLIQTFEKYVENDESVFIVHSDAAEDAQFLASEVKRVRPKVKTLLTAAMGPVIGSHGGLGAIGIMFVGKTKDIE
jgi:DegV family protein with EDD domain